MNSPIEFTNACTISRMHFRQARRLQEEMNGTGSAAPPPPRPYRAQSNGTSGDEEMARRLQAEMEREAGGGGGGKVPDLPPMGYQDSMMSGQSFPRSLMFSESRGREVAGHNTRETIAVAPPLTRRSLLHFLPSQVERNRLRRPWRRSRATVVARATQVRRLRLTATSSERTTSIR